MALVRICFKNTEREMTGRALLWMSVLCIACAEENADASPTDVDSERRSEISSDLGTASAADMAESTTDAIEPALTANGQANTQSQTDMDGLSNDTSVPPEPSTFVNISALLRGNDTKRRYGIAVTDFDGNGDFEVVVTGYGGANEVWDHQGTELVDIAPDTIKDPDRRAIGVTACDMDGDGSEEIYFLNVDRFGGLGEVSDRLYRRTENGWTDVFEEGVNISEVNRFSGRSVMCFDRDGDGKYGVFVANYGGPMKLFEAQPDWSLNDVASTLGMALTTGGRSLVNVPAADGRMRLFAGNENGPNFFFEGENPNYQNIAASLGIADPYETVRGVTVLDANEDGRFDLVYGNWNGPHRLFLDRESFFEDVTPPAMATPSRIRTVIAADFDNDGYEELFWNQIGEPNRLFKQVDGQWVVADIGSALEPDGLGTGAVVADVDGDGRLELFIAHGESGAQPLSVYRWGNQNNHYLRVSPLTKQGGPARGAVVVVLGTDRNQRRVVDTGSGYLCQMEPVAHFGMGASEQPVTVEVTWPDGVVKRISEVTLDQVLVIAHPEGD
jgi:hypothetical protein